MAQWKKGLKTNGGGGGGARKIKKSNGTGVADDEQAGVAFRL